MTQQVLFSRKKTKVSGCDLTLNDEDCKSSIPSNTSWSDSGVKIKV